MLIHIDTLDSAEVAVYNNLNENQLYHFYEPEIGVLIAESPNVIERALHAGYEPISMLVDEKYLIAEGKQDPNLDVIRVVDQIGEKIPVYTGTTSLLSHITGFTMVRGAICAMRRRVLPTIDELLNNPAYRRIVVLENVMNPANVGSIFRSAAALNVDAVLLTTSSADPLQRRSARVSMGTVFQVPWTIVPTWKDMVNIEQLHAHGYKTACMALTDNSVSISDPAVRAEDKLAILMGTESDGLHAETIAASDYTVKIPMTHGVDSLNVAAASAVAFWALCNEM